MNVAEAVRFIRPAVPAGARMWADLGAGRGIFTEALAMILGREGTVFAVDRDPAAVRALEQLRDLGAARLAAVVVAHGDFHDPDAIPELRGRRFDGVLLANALHFSPDPERVLEQLTARLEPNGRVVVIEYERSAPNRWVPFPLPADRLRDLTQAAGLAQADVVARRPSRYHREMYCAVALRAVGRGSSDKITR